MTRNQVIDEYFDWMYNLVCDRKRPYRRLFEHLHSRVFTYTIEMDGNREEDGIDLRYRFAYERGYDARAVATYLDNKPCSVLEMLIALSVRCEEHIMSNQDIGDQTGRWFWGMMDNLGLTSMYDTNFLSSRTDDIIDRFLNREYAPNGEGGLFTINNCRYDLRTVDIWYQLNWYLNTI